MPSVQVKSLTAIVCIADTNGSQIVLTLSERRTPKAREYELHVLGCQQPGAMAEAQGLQQRSHVEIRIKNITILNGTGAQNSSQNEDGSTTTHYANSHTLSVGGTSKRTGQQQS